MSQAYLVEVFKRAQKLPQLSGADDYNAMNPSFIFDLSALSVLKPETTPLVEFLNLIHHKGNFQLYPEAYIPETSTSPARLICSHNPSKEDGYGSDPRDCMQEPAVVEVLDQWGIDSVADLGFFRAYRPGPQQTDRFKFGTRPAL